MFYITGDIHGAIDWDKFDIAKLVLILADKDTDISEKLLCVRAAERFGYIIEEEAAQLLLYRTELERL